MPLKGVNVIEFAGLAPGPFCGMLLKEFGANVTRIDKVGQSHSIDVMGNGKNSIALNIKHKMGVEIIKKLCISSDVLIEPFRPGVMEHLGLGPNVLLKDNPKLIYARLTGFGQTGKYSPRAGHDINYVALSGVLSLLGRSNEKPTAPVNLVADFAGGGLLCALGITMALLERTHSAKGQIIDASMTEGSAYVGSWLSRSQKLPLWGEKRGCNLLDTGAHFYDTYETKDGKYMSVGALEPQFYETLLKGLELEDSITQFGDFDKKSEIFAQKFKEKTQKQWCDIFDDVDACVIPVLDIHETSNHIHNSDRKSFVKGPDYKIPVPKPAPVLSRTPGKSQAHLENPVPGKNTLQILLDLNYSIDAINTLVKEGVVDIAQRHKL